MTDREFWYRLQDRVVNDGGCDVDGNWTPGPSRVEVYLQQFLVLCHTPKGVWLEREFEPKRFVLLHARKRFACPTIQEAIDSFTARKLKQARIHREIVDRAQTAITLARKYMT